MLRGLGATPAAKRTGEQFVGLRSHQTFKNWMERYNVVDLQQARPGEDWDGVCVAVVDTRKLDGI